jgi:hypothetical protein
MAATKTVRTTNVERDAAWKKGSCQLCGKRIDIAKQKSILSDFDADPPEAKVVKARDKLNHYCPDCAKKRKTQRQYWLDNREKNGSKPTKAQRKPTAQNKAKGTSARPKASKASGSKRATVKKPSSAAK